MRHIQEISLLKLLRISNIYTKHLFLIQLQLYTVVLQKECRWFNDEIQADQFEVYVETKIRNNAGSSLNNNAMRDGIISDKPHLNTDEGKHSRAFQSDTGSGTLKEKAYFIATLLSLPCSFNDANDTKAVWPTMFGNDVVCITKYIHCGISLEFHYHHILYILLAQCCCLML